MRNLFGPKTPKLNQVAKVSATILIVGPLIILALIVSYYTGMSATYVWDPVIFQRLSQGNETSQDALFCSARDHPSVKFVCTTSGIWLLAVIGMICMAIIAVIDWLKEMFGEMVEALHETEPAESIED